VVRNLVENAIRYTPAGTTVEIAAKADGSITVTDAGPGIAEAERGLVFRRFWRRERGRTGGAGLGLAIVARIVEAHGGSVSISAAPGGGAVFTVALRRAAAPAAAADA
jgi:signal transduction histidine kinase